MRPDPAIRLWDGETLEILPDLTMIRGGGHFPGGSMLHWAKGAGGRGVLCSSDIATVTTDRKFLTFMWSYPNFIPLPASAVEGIAAALAPFRFDTIYGHYFDRVIPRNGKDVVEKSVARYVANINGTARKEGEWIPNQSSRSVRSRSGVTHVYSVTAATPQLTWPSAASVCEM